MRFALSRAVARCQIRRLSAIASTTPLPTAIGLGLAVVAPLVLARIGRALGAELASSVTSRELATALVLGPCLTAAAAGAVAAVALPPRAALGQQIAAGPIDALSARGASLLLPAALAALVVLPSLLSLSLAVATSFPGGWASGLALVAAIVSAAPVGAVAVEGVQVALRGPRLRLLPFGVGLAAWLAVGRIAGVIPLGPLAPAALALRSAASLWVALAVSGLTTIVLGGAWIVLAAEQREPRSRATRRRHFSAVWRRPLPAAAVALVWRRADVRRGAVASACFGAAGAGAAVASSAASPGPFLLATTTTLLGALVAALAGWGALVPGLWLWQGAPRGRRTIATTTWLAGLVGVAAPVALVGAVAAASSGVDRQTIGVVTILAVTGAAVATLAGALVPWRMDGLGDQVSSLSAFAAVALGASLVVGVVAPRLAGAGVPDSATATALCLLASGLAVSILLRRLEGKGR
jgi:hypothetical protein